MVVSCSTNVQQPDSKGYTITLFKCYPGNNLPLGRRCILIQETKFKSLGITSWSCLPFCLNSLNKTLALTLGCTKSKYDLCFLLIISSQGTLVVVCGVIHYLKGKCANLELCSLTYMMFMQGFSCNWLIMAM